MPSETPVINKPILNRELTDKAATFIYNFFGVLIFLTVVLIATLAWLIVLQPKFKAINSGEEFIRKTEDYQRQLRYYGSLNSIKASYEKISEADKRKIEAFVSTSDNASDLYSEIENLARASGMSADKIENKALDDKFEIVNISGSSKRNNLLARTKVWRTTLTLISDKAKGTNVSYSNLKKLLTAMESNLRLMDVQRVAFDPLNNTATIELLTYTRK